MTPLFEQVFHLCIEKRWSFCAFSTPGNSDFEMIIEDVNQTYKSDVGFVFHPFVVWQHLHLTAE